MKKLKKISHRGYLVPPVIHCAGCIKINNSLPNWRNGKADPCTLRNSSSPNDPVSFQEAIDNNGSSIYDAIKCGDEDVIREIIKW